MCSSVALLFLNILGPVLQPQRSFIIKPLLNVNLDVVFRSNSWFTPMANLMMVTLYFKSVDIVRSIFVIGTCGRFLVLSHNNLARLWYLIWQIKCDKKENSGSISHIHLLDNILSVKVFICHLKVMDLVKLCLYWKQVFWQM